MDILGAYRAACHTDIVADHPCGTYVFELKVDKPECVKFWGMRLKEPTCAKSGAG